MEPETERSHVHAFPSLLFVGTEHKLISTIYRLVPRPFKREAILLWRHNETIQTYLAVLHDETPPNLAAIPKLPANGKTAQKPNSHLSTVYFF
jgi:hypothetical protein